MDHLDVAQEVLDTIFGYLGFVVTVDLDRENNSVNVATSDPKLLIGHHGDRLEEIQYLANRIVADKMPNAKRFRVDIDNYRATREHRMIEEAEAVAAGVIASGKPNKLHPMNSYERRIIHNHFKDNPKVKTWSPQDNARLKRITILPEKEGNS